MRLCTTAIVTAGGGGICQMLSAVGRNEWSVTILSRLETVEVEVGAMTVDQGAGTLQDRIVINRT